MAYKIVFDFEPAEWLPIRDRELLSEIADVDLATKQGRIYENPEFDFQVVWDVHNYFVADLVQRIRLSDVNDEKLVLLLPNPENQVYISVVENLNKYNISCRNVHVFFVDEFANEKGEVAPWQSPYSRAGQFMKYFYLRLRESLRMPMEQIHFWTKENYASYSDMIAAEGGADVAYLTLAWAGGIGFIDSDSFPAETMEEFLTMGSRYVPITLENGAMESMRGMFGLAGDVGNVPPYAVTIGPKDIAAAKYAMHMEFLTSAAGDVSYQKFPLKLGLLGPISPKNPSSMMRLFPGTCYTTEDVAGYKAYREDTPWLSGVIEEIRKKEEN